MIGEAFLSARPKRWLAAIATLWLILGQHGVAGAQELAPRAYWPAPKGTSLLLLGYQFSTGDIITDPTLPVSGVQSDISYLMLGYQHMFDLFGRTASVQLSAPFTWGSTKGQYLGTDARRDLAGMGDARLRLAINLLGAPAMDLAGMQELRANPRTIVGFSLNATLPSGAYEPWRVLNEGTNRWSLKPAFGVIQPLARTWLFEAEVGVWLFGDNHDFLGLTRRQDPIWAGSMHVVKRIRPGFWASLDLNYYRGGETWVDGGSKGSLQSNSRVGGTLVFPMGGGHALRLAFSSGVKTASGGDYELYTLTYVRAWAGSASR